MFDSQFIQGTAIEHRLSDYHFFSYNTNEALFLTEEEKNVLDGLMANVRREIQISENNSEVQDDIIRDYILLILDYSKRFYKEIALTGSDIISRFQQLLIDYYDRGLQFQNGLPGVKYCAGELYLSAGYFGDIVRGALDESPKDYIRRFIIMRAKNLMLSGMNVSQVSEQLGFDYPNHFIRMFKSVTGQTPSEFFAVQSGRAERIDKQQLK